MFCNIPSHFMVVGVRVMQQPSLHYPHWNSATITLSRSYGLASAYRTSLSSDIPASLEHPNLLVLTLLLCIQVRSEEAILKFQCCNPCPFSEHIVSLTGKQGGYPTLSIFAVPCASTLRFSFLTDEFCCIELLSLRWNACPECLAQLRPCQCYISSLRMSRRS